MGVSYVYEHTLKMYDHETSNGGQADVAIGTYETSPAKGEIPPRAEFEVRDFPFPLISKSDSGVGKFPQEPTFPFYGGWVCGEILLSLTNFKLRRISPLIGGSRI